MNYILKIEDFEFKFTKRFFWNDTLEHFNEKFNLKDFPWLLDNVTMRNQKIKINFISSIKPFHFDPDTNISFSNIVKKYLESGKSTVDIQLADNIILLNTLVDQRRIVEFSGDGYGVVLTDVPDEEIDLKELLNSN